MRPRPPVLGTGVQSLKTDRQQTAVQAGPKVQMPVSLNIDRHLRKAEVFLKRQKYRSAFEVLQAVIEGRTILEDEGASSASSGSGEGADDRRADRPSNGNRLGTGSQVDEDAAPSSDAIAQELITARHAVFTADDRIYRPVKRLCHEMLSDMDAAGAAAYRAEFGFLAEKAFEEAIETANPVSLESISDRYFLTIHGARALEAAGDLRLDSGQFRAALQNYNTLFEVYPAAGRAEAGIDESYLQIRIALCLAWLGDQGRAHEGLETLSEAIGEDTALRIGGELVAAGSIQELPMFAESSESGSSGAAETGRQADGAETGDGAEPGSVPRFLQSEVVPLWEFRFEEAKPYRPIRESSRSTNNFALSGDGATMVSVQPDLFAPGTTADIHGGKVRFLEHFRMRTHEALSGRMLEEAADERLSERLRANQPRSRVAIYDHAAARVVRDQGRIFTVLGPQLGAKGMSRILDNRLVAYDEGTSQQLWSSEAHQSVSKVTFLAAPTPFGDHLLVPTLSGETVSMQAIEAKTGIPSWSVTVHSGGTDLSRPISAPVAIHQGIAYVMTGAGAIAAIDAHLGELRWIRRYERVHPFRPRPLRDKRKNEGRFFGHATYEEKSRLPGFAPGDVLTVNGMVIFAPVDGGVLHCLDGSTGEPIWMLNRLQRLPAGNLSHSYYIVGHDEERLVVGGEYDVYCIDIRTGIRLWRADLDNIGGTSRWRGRGVVHDGYVLIPGVQEILARPLAGPGSKPWKSIPLPELSIGREPLEGAFNLHVDGIYLTALFAGGVVNYTTVADLIAEAERAELPEQRALLQAQAGDLVAAFQTLETIDRGTVTSAKRQNKIATAILSITSELALAMAAHGSGDDALAILERARQSLNTRRDIKRWHLIKIELFEALGDSTQVQKQQLELYELLDSSQESGEDSR